MKGNGDESAVRRGVKSDGMSEAGAGYAVRCPLRDDLISKERDNLSPKVTPSAQEYREEEK